MAAKQLTGSLQNDVFSLLVFSKQHGPLIRNATPLELWSGDVAFKLLIEAVYTFIDQYKEPPEKHIVDLVSGLTVSDDKKKLLSIAVTNCEIDFKDITDDFVIKRLNEFILTSTLEQLNLKSLGLIKSGNTEAAYELLNTTIKQPLATFDPGQRMSEYLDKLASKTDEEELKEKIMLGIPELDNTNIVPYKGELYLFGGIMNAGKSFFLIHAGIQALRQGKKVLHVTLELDKDKVDNRYMRGFFGYGENPAREIPSMTFRDDDIETFIRPKCQILNRQNPDVLIDAVEKLNENRFIEDNLIVKQFPNRNLTITQLLAYIDSLEIQEKFRPEVLIIDYIPIMKYTGNKNKARHEELMEIHGRMRGLAAERGWILISAIQLTREASKSMKEGINFTEVQDFHIAGSYDMLGEADTVLMYSQNDSQRLYGIADINVIKARGSHRPSFHVAQDYNTGQFCISSHTKGKDFDKKITSKLKQEVLVDQ